MCIVRQSSRCSLFLTRLKKAIGMSLCISVITGCTMFPSMPPIEDATVAPIEQKPSHTLVKQAASDQNAEKAQQPQINETLRAAPLLRAGSQNGQVKSLELPSNPVQINADKLPIEQFIHLALGDILGVNYIIDSALTDKQTPITLRVNQPVSPDRLLGLVEEVLQVNGVSLAIHQQTLTVIPSKKSESQIPRIIDESIQPLIRGGNVAEIYPVYYLSLTDAATLAERFLRESGGGRVLMQRHLNALMLVANQEDLDRLKALLTQLDVPHKVGQNLSVVTPRYTTADSLIDDLYASLKVAGVPVFKKSGPHGVILSELTGNQVLVSATTQEWLNYTLEWAQQLDTPKPIESSNGVYAYYMQNAKAEDVWSVVSALFGKAESRESSESGVEKANIITAAEQRNQEGNRPTTIPGNTGYQPMKRQSNGNMSLSTAEYKVVVDSKRNALFFTGSYSDYQRLVNLLQFVDQRPRQVLLQATIAEVNVSDGFSLGVDFNAQGSGDISGGTSGLIESGNLNLAGIFGDVTANFAAALDSGRAQVLSSPRLIALDQESARINIGNQIQVRTGEINDGGSESTATVTYKYIDVGITLDITPSINQNGLVELTISQEVSNQGANVGGGPSINRRSIQTKVLADSGETVYLGGLIKQDTNSTENKVPLLGDIPLLGNLFKYQKETQDSVELVLLITPYMINSKEDAQFYTKQFRELTGWTLSE